MSNTVSTESLPNQDGSGAGGQRRLLMVVGGAALLVVLGVGAYFLFLSGGEEDLGPVPSGAAAAQESGGKKDTGSNGNDTKGNQNVPAEVDSDFRVGRDPFAPLPAEEVVVAPAPAPDDTSTDTTTSTSGTGGGTGTVPDPAPTVSSDPTPTPSPTPTADPVTSYKVTLASVDVTKDSAVIEVNGKRYVVKVKDMFTNSKTGPFKLTRVGELPSGKDSATVIFGSDAPVELVVKDTVVFKL